MSAIYAITFIISLVVICLELFFTTILTLKTWNHIVYLIIPFAILGYGIGANIYLIFKNFFDKIDQRKIISACLILSIFFSVSASLLLAGIEIHLKELIDFQNNWNSLMTLLLAYTTTFVPFIPFGFLIVYFFSRYPEKSSTLYFFDLLGAGLGAICFVLFITQTAVIPSIILLALTIFFLFLFYHFPSKRLITVALILTLYPATLILIKESPTIYAIDDAKGWENFSKSLKPHQYEWLVSQWTPLGRTDIYEIKDSDYMRRNIKNAFFRINLDPMPDFSYITTNITAGTPIFSLSEEGLSKHGSKIKLFSQPFEAPYLLMNKPKVVVIGTGGGKDIFIAKSHNAQTVTGADINPGTHEQMSKGGRLFEYSGKIYGAHGVKVHNVDGRNLAKTLPENTEDLIVLTGTDTFTGLLNGAYTYAESYLYTKEAMSDYLRILKANGVLNFNRRFFPEQPREGLKLFTTALAALKDSGSAKPEDHIIVGAFQKWTILMIKKTPFTANEKIQIKEYFQLQETEGLYPEDILGEIGKKRTNPFIRYVTALNTGKTSEFLNQYPYDVSIVTDNKPFFYKYYKFDYLHPFKMEYDRHTGTSIFITQFAVVAQALLFIVLFIMIPLIKFKISSIQSIPSKVLLPFIVYFSCLGAGFMFIEIPLMQKFVLLLGSPIYSISVTLTALLIFSGIGSLLAPHISKIKHLSFITCALIILLFAFILTDKLWIDQFVVYPFTVRVLIACLMLLPIGLCLGIFFPIGLAFFGKKHPQSIAWAWGINSAFSVLGSILSIILAQHFGFSSILKLAMCIYALATLSLIFASRSNTLEIRKEKTKGRVT